MKIRFYPKKELVLSLLGAKFARLSDEVAELESKAKKQAESVLYRSPERVAQDQSFLDAAIAERDDVANEVLLLESHDPPEVMAEIEV